MANAQHVATGFLHSWPSLAHHPGYFVTIVVSLLPMVETAVASMQHDVTLSPCCIVVGSKNTSWMLIPCPPANPPAAFHVARWFNAMHCGIGPCSTAPGPLETCSPAVGYLGEMLRPCVIVYHVFRFEIKV